MSENYKITRQMALKIIELRNDGLSFQAISEIIISEYKIAINESSARKFYKNFLDGKSRILPKAEMEVSIKKSFPSKQKTDIQRIDKTINSDSITTEIDKELTEIVDNQGLSDGSDFNKAKSPSNDLLGLFKDKPRNK